MELLLRRLRVDESIEDLVCLAGEQEVSAAEVRSHLIRVLEQDRVLLASGVRLCGVGEVRHLEAFCELYRDVVGHPEVDGLLERTGRSRGAFVMIADTEAGAFEAAAGVSHPEVSCLAVAHDRGPVRQEQDEVLEEASWLVQLLCLDGTEAVERALVPPAGRCCRLLLTTIADGMDEVERQWLLQRGVEQVNHLLDSPPEEKDEVDPAASFVSEWGSRFDPEGEPPKAYVAARRSFRVDAEAVTRRVVARFAGEGARHRLREEGWKEAVCREVRKRLEETVGGQGGERGVALTVAEDFAGKAGTWQADLERCVTGQPEWMGLKPLHGRLQRRVAGLRRARGELGDREVLPGASLGESAALGRLEEARIRAVEDLGRMPPEGQLKGWLGLAALLVGLLIVPVLRLLADSLGPPDPSMKSPGWDLVLFYLHTVAWTALQPPWVAGVGMVLTLGAWNGLLSIARSRVQARLVRHFGPMGTVATAVCDVVRGLDGRLDTERGAFEDAIDKELILGADATLRKLARVTAGIDYTARCLGWLRKDLDGVRSRAVSPEEEAWSLHRDSASGLSWTVVPPASAFQRVDDTWTPEAFWDEGLYPLDHDEVDRVLLWSEVFMDLLAERTRLVRPSPAMGGAGPQWPEDLSQERWSIADRNSTRLVLPGATMSRRLGHWSKTRPGAVPPWAGEGSDWEVVEGSGVDAQRIWLVERVTQP